jgi:acyl-homoserine-lactone acylase
VGRRGRRGGRAAVVAVVLAGLPVVLVPAAAQGGQPRILAQKEPGKLSATITRTKYGIPHITADDYKGLGYGYGYAFAQDNICTIADSYVTVSADRSRFFGPDARWANRANSSTQNNLNSDFFFQRIIDDEVVEDLISKEPPLGPRDPIRAGIEGYVVGYNAYLEKVGRDRIPNPACRGEKWVRPIREIDAYRRFYQLALLASSGVAVDGIGSAQPLLGGAQAPAPASAQTQRMVGDLAERFQLMGMGSNAYGLGAKATRSGHGMVLANPHFPWDGSERFYQSHLTIPGKVNVSGASLFGVPIILIGHTQKLAWSHTVSTSRRFGLFQETLVPGQPTKYVVDGEVRDMEADEVTVKARAEGGGLEKRTRTLYSTGHGPVLTSILGLPLFPWTPVVAHSIGDANAANFRYVNHFLRANQAQSVRELYRILKEEQGIPWVNTIAADSRGEAFYADMGVTPNVTDEHADRCNTALGAVAFAALRVPVLDGSRSECDWANDPDSLQPGTFGPSRLPHLFRDDYVENSNDSHWLANPREPLEGYDLIIGDERTERALRTRIGLIMADQRIAGADGRPGKGFTLGDLRATVFSNRQYAGELLRDELVQTCRSSPTMLGSSGPVDVSEACDVLAAWDLHENVDSRGALLFRRFGQRALSAPGGLPINPVPSLPFSTPFDASDPVNTPRGLNPLSPTVVTALADAVTDLRDAGIPLDAPYGEYHYEMRGKEKIPIHGGSGTLGSFNLITNAWKPGVGFPDVEHGSSFVMTTELKGRCPKDRSIITYSLSANPRSKHYADQTRLFSRKKWVDPPFCANEVEREAKSVMTLGPKGPE